jgi:pyruvate dehydrogenase E2 component (dihydrolipoamide acetyltransferase)
MAFVLIMPRQGNTVESCIIDEWKVREGDAVTGDTPVCVVETDKATFEVPSGADGTVLKILHPAGDDVPVLMPIMVVGNLGENWEAALPAGTSASAAPAASGGSAASAGAAPVGTSVPAAPAAAVAGTVSPSGTAAAASAAGAVSPGGAAASPGAAQPGGGAAASPRARKLADAEAVDLAALGGTGPGGRIIARDVAAAAAGRAPLTAAAKDELRRRIAAGAAAGSAAGAAAPALGEAGSGIGGRITLADLGRPAAETPPAVGQEAAATTAAEYTDTPIKGIRKVIFEQMTQSHLGTAAFTLNSSASALNLQSLRGRFKESPPELGLNRITINDLVLFAVSRILPLYPYMNAHKLEGLVRTFRDVHLGVAVSTPRGLMVPVIRNADSLSLTQISRRAKELAEACRGGNISPDDLHGSTFTVTNLGNTGVESFSPVINIPESAILGVCGIQPKPAETSPGHYEILPHLGFSLTIDHSVVDGAPAAEFLKTLCGAVRDIDIWIAK